MANDPNKPQPRNNEESPKQQLERYLHAEIEYEIRSLQFEGDEDRPWTGILTDGRVWHVWRYAHQEHAVGTTIQENFIPQDPTALLDNMLQIVDKKTVGKPWVPLNPQSLFNDRLEALRDIHAKVPKRAQTPLGTKRHLWLEMLRSASMEPNNEAALQRLFVAHSFLVALARGVIHVLANPGAEPEVNDTLKDGFVAWIVSTTRGQQWANGLLKEINAYEWRRRPGDILRPLYEHFVDADDRKAFGEFYTPDWLAELLVREVCDDTWCQTSISKALSAHRRKTELKGVGVLDPTCGSGTFLYHAAIRLLNSEAMKSLDNSTKAEVVCSLVHGIDVHPVAAEIARATLLRALPAEPPHGKAALRIHEGDALLLQGDDENSLFRPVNGDILIQTPKGREVLLPRYFVERTAFPHDLRRLIQGAMAEEDLPADITVDMTKSDREAMNDCHQQFVEIIKKEGNSVWTWYILNTTAPHLLSNTKVNRIVANPPWVKMSNIQAEVRKRTLENFASSKDIALAMGGKQAPHLDIAQLFIKRTRQLYLADIKTDPAAWLVKRSALGGANWAVFRDWHKSLCKQTLDLDALKPFGGGDARRCCVLFEGRPSGLFRDGKRRVKTCANIIATLKGTRPVHNEGYDDVLDRISYKKQAQPIPSARSDFIDSKNKALFRQGATVTPKVLTVIESVAKAHNRKEQRITTASSMHKPWLDIEQQQGDVPKDWIRNLLVSKAVLPFSISPLEHLRAIIPANNNGMLDVKVAETCAFWRTLNTIYEENSGAGRNTPKNLISQIDFSRKLTAQLQPTGDAATMVLYPASGDIMRACRIRPGEAIVDATLYWFIAPNASEAAYLTALMNAPCLKDAFVQSRSSGRHFHLNPWRYIPVCRYNHAKAGHRKLVSLTRKAERIVESWLKKNIDLSSSDGQVALSMRLRSQLLDKGVFAEIDSIARKILPDQSSPL